jgi:GNAT superfamily N-acetyltransferase
MPMAPASLYEGFVEPAPHAHADESAFGADHSEFRMLRAKRFPGIGLALRPARSSDGDALQTYVRGLSPRSRYNRFLGAASELSASELARALAANARATLTLLLTSTAAGRELVVGEARVALWCAERAGEFSMSIADDWRHIGLGSALLEEIERKAAVDGIELLFGDVLRTNGT